MLSCMCVCNVCFGVLSRGLHCRGTVDATLSSCVLPSTVQGGVELSLDPQADLPAAQVIVQVSSCPWAGAVASLGLQLTVPHASQPLPQLGEELALNGSALWQMRAGNHYQDAWAFPATAGAAQSQLAIAHHEFSEFRCGGLESAAI